jgi:hypothetical protein
MKVRVSQKSIKEAFSYIIPIGYCQAYNMLAHRNPNFYTAGMYGWNSDIYVIDNNTVIVTGYRTFGTIKPRYSLVEKYEQRAAEGDKTALEDFLKEVLAD